MGYGAPDSNRNYHKRVEGPRVRVRCTRDKACDRGTWVTREPRVVAYLACLRLTATPRLASSATVNSMGMTARRLWSRQYRSGRSGLSASSSSLATAEVELLSPPRSFPDESLSGGASVASDRSRIRVARDNKRVAADLRCGRMAVMAWSCRKRR